MSKPKKRKRIGKSEAASGNRESPDLVLKALMPGALMFRRTFPAGLPDTHSARSAHVHCAGTNASVFASLATDEKVALLDSISKTLRRAEYHRLRYVELRAALDTRRENLPGEVFWDEFVENLHFEMQAFCGAARMLLDELIYLIARLHAVPEKRARRKPWETADLMTEVLPAECQVLEMVIARSRVTWFRLLNAYRNSFFHHGWRHGTGHYGAHDDRQAASEPAANALLVPDQESLARRSKPHEWTYKNATTTDEVVRLAYEGLDGLLKDLCEQAWATPEPALGRMPRKDQPNMLVSLVIPTLVDVHGTLLVPFFTSREHAEAFEFMKGAEAELVEVPVSTAVLSKPAVTFSMRGLEHVTLPPGADRIKVIVDAVAVDGNWKDIRCTAVLDVSIADLLRNPVTPVSLPVVNVARLFTWQRPNARDWRL